MGSEPHRQRAMRRGRRCHLCMHYVMCLTDPKSIRRYLARVGEPTEPPARSPRGCGLLVFGLEELAYLDLGLIGAKRDVELEPALGAVDGFVLRLRLNEREPRDELLCFGEGPVDHEAFASGGFDPRAERARLQPLAREHRSRL